MEWSFGKNRMASALERLLEPPKKVRWRFRYFCCCFKTDDTDVSPPAVWTE